MVDFLQNNDRLCSKGSPSVSVSSLTINLFGGVSMLRVALPNGTMEEPTVKFFNNAGITFEKIPRQYRARVRDPKHRASEAVFMRPHIIPYLVAKNHYDLGFTGSDQVMESDGGSVATLTKFNCFNKHEERTWKVVLLGRKEDPAQSIKDIQDGVVILSEYPNITQAALDWNGKKAEVLFSHGATEAHIPHDFPYGVCLAQSHATLEANNLKIIQVISVEMGVIIGSPKRTESREKEMACISLLDDLLR